MTPHDVAPLPLLFDSLPPLTENVFPSYARGRDGELLHQLEQTLSDGVPASCAASQYHEGQNL